MRFSKSEEESVRFLCQRMCDFNVRLNLNGTIVTQHPLKDYCEPIRDNHLKCMLRSWYKEKFSEKSGASLDRFLTTFIRAVKLSAIEARDSGVKGEEKYVSNTWFE